MRIKVLVTLLVLLVASVALFFAIMLQREPTIVITLDLGGVPQLSDGTCAIIHCNRAQTDALPLRGPEAGSRVLGEAEIDHLWSSPIAGGILDYTYPDGRKVFWVAQVDRIMKLRLNADNNLEKVAELPLETNKFPRRSPEDMQKIVADLDAAELGSEAYDKLAGAWHGYQLEGLRAYYAMVNNAGVLYVGNRDSIVAYGDEDAGNPDSAIAKVGQYGFKKLKLQLGLKMPLVIMIGLNMTPDGQLVAVTIDGTVIVVKPDLSEGVYYNLPGEQIWNSVAIDEDGGIYVVGNKRLHKLVWTGTELSDDPELGAWMEGYAIGTLDKELRAERGSGTTPALMGGPDDRHRFVVIADAANVNNLILYWRDEIPEGWQRLPGSLSRRVAGTMPVNFGNPEMTNSYSESSAVVFDYGAVIANNQVRTNEKMMMDVQLKMKDPERTPKGIQKFQWNPNAGRLESAWTRADVSSPNSTPVVATKNRQLHVVGLQGQSWVMQTLDWDTGETRAVYTLGHSERYNPIMLALQLLPNGDPIFAAFGGVIHLKLGALGSAK